MEEFKKTLEIISTLRENCPLDKIRTNSDVINFIKEELDEVKVALKTADDDNLKEELGDLLFNILFLINIEEEEKGINASEILEKVNNKMIFRHPHVFEDKREVTIEEANKIWKEQKNKEKIQGIVH